MIQVERVHRLSELVHHVIGDVSDVVDGSLTYGLESFDEPLRRGTNFHSADDSRGESRAKIFRFESHRTR